MNDLTDVQLRVLQEAQIVTQRDQDKEGWLGFEWHEVHANPATLNSLVSAGILDIGFQSRRTTCYRLHNDERVQAILSGSISADTDESDSPLIIPHDFLDIIIGHEQTKNIVKMAIMATDPVHLGLFGPPASGKTLIMDEIARLPSSRYALGGTSSRAGIVDFLLDTRPRFLIMDEIDKASNNDMDVLLSLMETGRVTRLKKGMRESVTLRTWVIVGGNTRRYLGEAFQSRLIKRELQAYTPEEFAEISRAILVKRERIDPAWADEITRLMKDKTINPRDAVKVARMVHSYGDIREAVEAVCQTI